MRLEQRWNLFPSLLTKWNLDDKCFGSGGGWSLHFIFKSKYVLCSADNFPRVRAGFFVPGLVGLTGFHHWCCWLCKSVFYFLVLYKENIGIVQTVFMGNIHFGPSTQVSGVYKIPVCPSMTEFAPNLYFGQIFNYFERL